MAQITEAQGRPLTSAPGMVLRADAAAAWDAAVKAYGKPVPLTSAWRSLATQERLFRERYRQGNHVGQPGYTTDVRNWNGQPWTRLAAYAAAAVPGTSNHGGGIAVDVSTNLFSTFNDPDRVAFLKTAAPYGWADDEGRRVNECWHLTYYPDRDKHGTTSPTAPGTTKPPTPSSDEDLEVLMSYPFLFRADTNDAVSLVLAPGRMLNIPPADWANNATHGDIVALTSDGKVHTVGAGTAAAMRRALA